MTRYICASGKYAEDEIRTRLLSEIDFQKMNGVQYWPNYKLDDGDLIGCCGGVHIKIPMPIPDCFGARAVESKLQ